MKKIHKTIEPTADSGIKIEASDLPALFKKAAQAMFEQMIESAELPKKPRKKVVKVEVKGGNQEEVLVVFLKELLHLSDEKNVVFKDIEVTALDVTFARAIAVGIPRRHFKFKNEINAVSYQGLKIIYLNKKYHAQIKFDMSAVVGVPVPVPADH